MRQGVANASPSARSEVVKDNTISTPRSQEAKISALEVVPANDDYPQRWMMDVTG
jgi:hypothetical protein